MSDEFQSDCIYLISEANISRISEMRRLDSASPVPVLHLPSWIGSCNSSDPLFTLLLLCELT